MIKDHLIMIFTWKSHKELMQRDLGNELLKLHCVYLGDLNIGRTSEEIHI